MKRTYRKILRNRKARIERRLAKKNWCEQEQPMMRGSNIQYEISEKTRAQGCGGIGAIHLMAQRLGLVKEIDQSIELLKVHLPYHESDHVLNVAYNILAGGQRLEDMELRRQDECYLNGLGAQRTPDPTTAGDFTRRFDEEDILKLQEAINRTRRAVWDKQPKGFLKEAFVDVDGTIAQTYGECKGDMALSYKGIWGYAPLVVSLANTKEVLYVINRPGNATSNYQSVGWIEKALELVGKKAKQVTVRGDTDFTNTEHLDRWNQAGWKFILGMDAHVKAVKLADELSKSAWKALERLPQYEIRTEPRGKRDKVKEEVVVQMGYKNQKLVAEHVAEIEYQPTKCAQPYRLIILRKNISVQTGEQVLFEEIRYFFYITNRSDLSAEAVISLANDRCDQENVIEQLKNGVNAMRMPVDDLLSNGAYMVMAALAWNLKAWYALLVPDREKGLELLRMEFRRFLHSIILIPAQIVCTGRRIIYRFLGYNSWLKDFFATWERLLTMSSG